MVRYPARMTKEGEYYLISFRDFHGSEPVTQGFTPQKAEEMAKEWLSCQQKIYKQHGETLPEPSKAQDGEILIELPVSGEEAKRGGFFQNIYKKLTILLD